MAKDIQVLVKYPSKFLSESDLSGLGMLGHHFKESVDEIVKQKVAEKIIKKMEIPEIKISKKELKKAMINKIVERKLDG